MKFVVNIDADALVDWEEVKAKNERKATLNAIDKLRELGPRLVPPHTKALKAETDLFELRPKQGRSKTRPIYAREGATWSWPSPPITSPMVTRRWPEPDSVSKAARRAASHKPSVIIVGMAKSEGITYGQLVAQELNDDGGFREEWQRLAPARAFAAVLIRYRAEHDLSQSKLGKRLGVTQPRVAALESGERNPDYETIINAVDKLQVEFAMDFSPSRKPPKLLTKTARAAGSTVTYRDVAVTVTSR